MTGRLRNGIGQVFVSLARRNQSLLQRQLRLIDALEQKASDPATLADLFPLDHLTTRMRRHAEGLIILSGAAPGRSWSEPVPVIDVIRGRWPRSRTTSGSRFSPGPRTPWLSLAAADMIHLLAELIENATLSSPSGTRVEVRAERVANGFAIEIDDRGLGIEADQLRTINQQLAQPPDFDLANADQLGLFVVGKLAARHGGPGRAPAVSLRRHHRGGAHAQQHRGARRARPRTDTESRTSARSLTGRPPGLDLRRRRRARAAPQSAPAHGIPASGCPPAETGTPVAGSGLAPGPAAAARPPAWPAPPAPLRPGAGPARPQAQRWTLPPSQPGLLRRCHARPGPPRLAPPASRPHRPRPAGLPPGPAGPVRPRAALRLLSRDSAARAPASPQATDAPGPAAGHADRWHLPRPSARASARRSLNPHLARQPASSRPGRPRPTAPRHP